MFFLFLVSELFEDELILEVNGRVFKLQKIKVAFRIRLAPLKPDLFREHYGLEKCRKFLESCCVFITKRKVKQYEHEHKTEEKNY